MFAQLVRFALVGGASNVVYGLAFVVLSSHGVLTANFLGAILSTALANELHRSITFGASERVGWLSAQLEGGGLALVGLVVSTLAIGAFHSAYPAASALAAGALVVSVSAAIGGLRFLALRGLVFAA